MNFNILFSIILLIAPVKQIGSMDCSIASTQMILEYYGRDTVGLYEEMRGETPIDEPLSAEVETKALQDRGLKVNWLVFYPSDFEVFIIEEIKQERPVIVIIDAGGTSLHSVVVTGASGDWIRYIDPFNGKSKVLPMKWFKDKAMTDYGIFALKIEGKRYDKIDLETSYSNMK